MARYQLISREEFFLNVWPTKALRDETFELRVLRRNPNRIYRRSFFHSTEEFLRGVDEISDRIDDGEYYFGIATRRGESGTKDGCFRARAVWVDLDGTKDLKPRLPELNGLDPDIIVDSGGGLHLYWILRTPLVLQEKRWVEIESINRGLCKKLFGDIASIDITRILRVPGTNNNKYSPVRPVKAYKLKCTA